MKVKQLIKLLQKEEPNMEIVTMNNPNGYYHKGFKLYKVKMIFEKGRDCAWTDRSGMNKKSKEVIFMY